MRWLFSDDVTVWKISTIVRCTRKSGSGNCGYRTSQNPFACGREERVWFRPNQPTGGDLRPISAGSDELREKRSGWRV